MMAGLHCRFVKRFIAAAVLVIFFGFFLMSKWSQDRFGIQTVGLIEDDGGQVVAKTKRLTTNDEHDVAGYFSRRNENYDESRHHDPSFTSASWIKDVLEQNLTKEETVHELLKDFDKNVPDEGIFDDLISTEKVHSQLIEKIVTTSSAPGDSSRRAIARKFPRRKRKKKKRPNSVYAGFLNVHIWRAWCGSSVEDLRRNKHFPLYPDRWTITNDFFVRRSEVSFGQRVFGFIHPPKSGNFTFYISSDDNSELWLSNSSNPEHIRKIAWVGNKTFPMRTSVAEFDVDRNQVSGQIYLYHGKMYFIEVLHKQRGFSNHVLVAWKGPGMPKTKVIDRAYVSAYLAEDELSSDVNVLAEYIPETTASYPTHHHGTLEVNEVFLRNVSEFGAEDERDHFHLMPSMDDKEIEGILPECPYNPSYLVNFEVNRYEGVYLIHETAVYPDDKTELTHMIPLTDCDLRTYDSHGVRLRPDPNKIDQTPDEAEQYTKEDHVHSVSKKSYRPVNFSSSPGAVVVDKNLNSLISKLKSQFKDFNSYLKSNMRIFGGKGKVSYESRKVGAGKSAEEATKSKLDDDESESRKEVGGELQVDVGFKKELKSKKTKKHDARGIRKHYKSSVKSKTAKKGVTENLVVLGDAKSDNIGEHRTTTNNSYPVDSSHGNLVVKQERGSLEEKQNQHGGIETGHSDVEKIIKQDFKQGTKYSSRSKKFVNRKLRIIHRNTASKRGVLKRSVRASKSGDYASTFINGRKLLSTEDKQVVFAYETDDEGLPSSWNKYERAKPIFVPIDDGKDLSSSKEKVVAIKSDKNIEDDVDDEYTEPFHMKTAYKKLNITSNRDVMEHFKIFKYAFYDMIKDEPRPLDWIYHHRRTECKSDGNLRLNEKVAISIVNKYMRELRKRHGDKYTLKKVINVEENHDVIKGDRYLIELDLKMKGEGDKSFRLSRYVYQQIGNTDLCEPLGFQWNRHATVHVIVPVKNQGRWVQHFIDNMEQIYLETLDSHLNVIIVDFNSTDIDIEKSLKNSKLKRYKLIKLDGPFQRALGIQAGADAVEDPHDIIFTCDLHLEIPSALIDSIRKHCVEGKMAFAPIVVRLDCGYLPDSPYGLWELQGYGLFAICKSDFDKAGGMNTKEFKTKWGGEDWEMLDRILSNKLEVERLRVPKFYHYYHTKIGMWSKTR